MLLRVLRKKKKKKKTAKKALFVHHQSAIPKKSKINFIRNERKRVDDRCSTQTTTTKHQDMFDDILRLNAYPKNSIDQTKHSQSQQRDSRHPYAAWSYLRIPYMYISERLNHKITNFFRVRVAHKSYTLRRALSHNTTERKCPRKNCPTSSTKLCLLRNAVHQITCNNCNQHYIGSTTCFIHDRVREHLNSEHSSVKKHISTCKTKTTNALKSRQSYWKTTP